MQQIIDKMRTDFVLVAKQRRELGEWSQSDEAEFAASIKAAIERGDKDLILCWARWLADLAAWCVAYRLLVVGTETRIRAQIALEKAEKESQ